MEWQKLKDTPYYLGTNPVVLSDSQFLVLSTKNHLRSQYDTTRNRWRLYCDTKSSIDSPTAPARAIAYDKDADKLFITTNEQLYRTFVHHIHYPIPGPMVMIGGDLHVFFYDRGDGCLHHNILRLQTQYEDKERLDAVPVNTSTSVVAAVHSESRNSIILLCNSRNPEDIPEIIEFSLSTKAWNIRTHPDIHHDVTGAAMVCTVDGRHVIIFGGTNYYDYGSDEITLYDLEDPSTTPSVSSIRCPAEGGFHSLTMIHAKMDELATFGFIRCCFKSPEMNKLQFMPIYLMEMMAKWIEMEWIYLLERKGNGHWRMRVDDILKSVECSSMKRCLSK